MQLGFKSFKFIFNQNAIKVQKFQIYIKMQLKFKSFKFRSILKCNYKSSKVSNLYLY